MSLLNLAGLALAAVALPIILLYLLKMRRTDRRVSSLLLWREVIADLQANTPFQRLRRNLLMLLQVLAVLLLALALARPIVRLRETGGRHLVLVVDTSASMSARDAPDGRSRLEAARADALEVVEDMGRSTSWWGRGASGDACMVVEAAAEARTVQGFTSDLHALRSALSTLGERHVPTNLEDALLLAMAAVRGRGEGVEGLVHLFSDGASPRLPELSGTGVGLRYHAYGSRADNLGIVALKSGEERGRTQVLVTVANAGDREARRFLNLHGGGVFLDARELSVPPGGRASAVFEGDWEAGVLELSLDGEDPLACDDVARLVLRAGREVRVLLVSPGNPVVERALAATPDALVERVDPAGVDALDPAGHDLVIYDAVVPAREPDRPALYLDPPAAVGPAEPRPAVRSPAILDWARDHPLLRFVDLGDVHLAAARPFVAGPRLRPLVTTDAGAVLVAMGRGDHEHWALGLDVYGSDWPLRASFPIFFKNLVALARRGGGDLPDGVARTGRPVALPAEGLAEVEVVSPDGTRYRLEARDGQAYFGATDLVGVYRVIGGGRTWSFAASLLDAQESDIRTRGVLEAGGRRVEAVASGGGVNREVWGWLVGAALAVLAVEWVAFHRRW
ncbi:MAG: VWA domain-containing protein [Planctomycetes bacterium]|nr:VWA domain-containing protein [Planctomycetota bacterium]